MPRRKSKGTDQSITGHHWRRVIRGHWMDPRNRGPCSRCGKAIDYDGPRYLAGPNGTRRQNPRYLIVGHIIGRHQARQLGWTDEQINALPNTQPECQHCSNSSGAKYGNRLRRTGTPTPPTSRITHAIDDW